MVLKEEAAFIQALVKAVRTNPYTFRRGFTSLDNTKTLVRDIKLIANSGFLRVDDGVKYTDESFEDHTDRILSQWRWMGAVTDHQRMREISALVMDVFQEPLRARSRRKGHKSPVELWKEASDETLRSFVRLMTRWTDHWPPFMDLNPCNFRFFCSRVFPYCADFRGDLAHSVLDFAWRLQEERTSRFNWVDPCAGWGCRLLAATTSPFVNSYTGFDPNSALRDGHAQMAAVTTDGGQVQHTDLLVDIAGRFRVIYETWEQGNKRMPEDCCDIVFTSPPFWDKELYHCKAQDAGRQASAAYKDMGDFCKGFVDSLVKDSARLLRSGGVLASQPRRGGV